MHFVRSHQADLHTALIGDAAAPAVTMVHGLLTGSMATWYFNAAGALVEDYKVVLYDLRGHGKSSRTEHGYDMATMVDDLLAVIDYHQLDETILVGHSFGGLVALHFAIAHPDRVSQLILVDIPLPASDYVARHFSHVTDENKQALFEALPEDIKDQLNANKRGVKRALGHLEFLLFGSSLLADLRQSKDLSNAELAAIDCPVHCIYGEKSDCKAVAERLINTIKDATIEWLPAGHFIPVEAPMLLSNSIKEYLRGTH